MSGASEVPAIPEEVRKIASDAATECMPFETAAWYNVRREIEQAIMADRLARPVDTGREKALEERKDRERQIRVSEYRRAVEWLHGRAMAMNDPHARAVLDLAGDEYGRYRSRALANPENGRG